MEPSSDRFILYIMSLYAVFLPLFWSATAGVLKLLERVSSKQLDNPRVWFRMVNMLFCLILFLLGALILSSLTCLAGFQDYSLASVCGIVVYVLFSLLVFLLVLWIWFATFSEFLLKLRELGM